MNEVIKVKKYRILPGYVKLLGTNGDVLQTHGIFIKRINYYIIKTGSITIWTDIGGTTFQFNDEELFTSFAGEFDEEICKQFDIEWSNEKLVERMFEEEKPLKVTVVDNE